MVYLEPGWTGINDMAYSTVYAAISVFYFFFKFKKIVFYVFCFSMIKIWPTGRIRIRIEYIQLNIHHIANIHTLYKINTIMKVIIFRLVNI